MHAQTATTSLARADRSEHGQVLVIFAASALLFMLLCASVIDMSWYWTNNLRMQRAADAAALAGVVFLPGDPDTAVRVAREEAAKNGYADGLAGVVVTPAQDTTNLRRLNVSISGTVATYFARVVGITEFPARRIATADYVLPVPMGSPENFYGVGYFVAPVTKTVPHVNTATSNSGWKTPTTTPGTAGWTASPGTLVAAITTNDTIYARTTTNNSSQQFGTFNLSAGLGPNDVITAIYGLQVRLTDANVSAKCASSKLRVALSWTGGGTTTNWTTTANDTIALTTSTTAGDTTFGSTSNLNAWAGHAWTPADLGNASLAVRVTALKGCTTAGTELRLDQLEVYAAFQVTTTTYTTTTTLEQQAVTSPSGTALKPQNFWAAMQSQGAPSVQGDAFMTKYETRIQGGGVGTLNSAGSSDPDARYDPSTYFNYVVQIPKDSSNGAVWIFDPGFCDASSEGGTGENWSVSGTSTSNPNGYTSRQPVSAYFDLLDTRGTAFDLSDDRSVASTGTTFKRQSFEDHRIFSLLSQSTNVPDCSALSWHYGWYQLAANLPAGDYRLHTYSTDPTSVDDQKNTTALNAFAFYATADGGSPRIYGLGAMEAYVRLPGGTSSEFYLAQIEAVHAGKTMVINLWDPGDTGQLAADLEILRPTGTGFTPAAFDYQGTVGTSNPGASACGTRSGTDVTSVVTSTGGGSSGSRYNGCWLTIEIQLPADYDAPLDPVSGEPGWWKIRYNMDGVATDFSTDLTTWKVDIRGNPVHLIVP